MENLPNHEDVDIIVQRVGKITESIDQLSKAIDSRQRNTALTYFDNATEDERNTLKKQIMQLTRILEEELGASRAVIARNFFGLGRVVTLKDWIRLGTVLPQRFMWMHTILPKIRDANYVRTFVKQWM